MVQEHELEHASALTCEGRRQKCRKEEEGGINWCECESPSVDVGRPLNAEAKAEGNENAPPPAPAPA